MLKMMMMTSSAQQLISKKMLSWELHDYDAEKESKKCLCWKTVDQSRVLKKKTSLEEERLRSLAIK